MCVELREGELKGDNLNLAVPGSTDCGRRSDELAKKKLLLKNELKYRQGNSAVDKFTIDFLRAEAGNICFRFFVLL